VFLKKLFLKKKKACNNFQNGWPIFIKLESYDLCHFLDDPFSDLEILLWWRHTGYFVCFAKRHFHGRNFSSIFFKTTNKVQFSLPVSSIENQQDQLITSVRKSGPRYRKVGFGGHGFDPRQVREFLRLIIL